MLYHLEVKGYALQQAIELSDALVEKWRTAIEKNKHTPNYPYDEKIKTVNVLIFVLDGVRELPAILVVKSHASAFSSGWRWMNSEINSRRSIDLDDAAIYLTQTLETQIKSNTDIAPILFILSIVHDLNNMSL